MSGDKIVDFMQRLKEREQQKTQAIDEERVDELRRIVADAVMAMQRLGATDDEISFRLEVAATILDEQNPNVEEEMELTRQRVKFTWD
jgi:hypothetical protein